MSTNDAIEQEIVDKGLTSPRVTPADIESVIKSEYYFTARDGVDGRSDMGDLVSAEADHVALGLLTFCVLILQNGFTVTGQSAVASPENFDAAIGKKIARADAVNKIWPLLGYELKSKLAELPIERKLIYVDVGTLSKEQTTRVLTVLKEELKKN